MNRRVAKMPDLVLRGIVAKDRQVAVYIDIRQGAVMRPSCIYIDAELLLHEDVLAVLDRAARRKLNEKWDGAQDSGLW